MAASRRNLLASRLPLVISVRRRILYDTERALWPLVSREMGAAYASNQRAALGVEDQTFAESVHGALAMYSLAHEQCRDVLDPEQAQVADASLSLIRGYAAP
jgi:hypothetical protein